MPTLRSGVEDLIALVARLVGDVNYEIHTTGDIQDALDRHRWEARYLRLDALPTKASGGGTTYTTFVSPSQDWRYFEDDGVLYDANFDALTPATSDWTDGRWTFSAEPTRAVTLLGWSHDPYAAAADLLEARATALSEDVSSFGVYNGQFTYSGAKYKGPQELAAHYRSKSRSSIMQSVIYRTDINIW